MYLKWEGWKLGEDQVKVGLIACKMYYIQKALALKQQEHQWQEWIVKYMEGVFNVDFDGISI